MKVAEGTLYLESIPANGITMGPARNERHIVSNRSHSPAEIASHGTRCHDRDPHFASLRRHVFAWPNN